MRKIDPIIFILIGLTVIVFAGVIIAGFNIQEKPVKQYKTEENSRPQMEILETQFDFGKMALTDIKTKEIEIKNIGGQPLIISKLFTSCDCTFAKLKVGNQESPRFSMWKNFSWRMEIPPGGSGILSITYEPKIMPVQ